MEPDKDEDENSSPPVLENGSGGPPPPPPRCPYPNLHAPDCDCDGAGGPR